MQKSKSGVLPKENKSYTILDMRLIIGNSECKIENITRAVYLELRELMHYTIDDAIAFHSNSRYNLKKYLIDKHGNFPTGLLYLAEHYIATKNIKILRNDTRTPPKRFNGLFYLAAPHPLYDEQNAAVEACRKFKRGVVVMPTGTGKSLVAAAIVNEFQVPTLIVVPSLELKRQLTHSCKQLFGADRVGELGFPLAIENVDALNIEKPLKGYGCVIIDEFHHSGAETYRKLNKNCWKDVYYKFGLTATPFRSKDNERLLLESVLSQVIYKLDYFTAVDKGYIVPIQAYYVEVPRTKLPIEANRWPQVYSKIVVNNEPRNAIIREILTNLSSDGKSTICLVKEIQHGINLNPDGAYSYAKGENDNNKQLIESFNSNQITTLIGTTGVLGEGVDSKPAEYIIIAGLGKSRNAFMQNCGRGVRRYPGKESCKVIIFLDKSHKWSINHFKEQCKILKEEYDVIPVCLT